MNESELTHFSLFSGIGGIDLAAEWAGFETVGQVEKNEHCQKVLTKHWPDVPGWSDVRDVTAESVRETVGDDRFPPTLVSGGFPCQPFSSAGKRMGAEDDRDLWPEMFRVIREIRPDWVLGENVANFANMGLDRTVSDLENEDYRVRTFEIPAVAVGAHHQRMRCFIVAHNNRGGCIGEDLPEGWGGERERTFELGGESEAYSHSPGGQRNGKSTPKNKEHRRHNTNGGPNSGRNGGGWKITESPVCRADDGVSDRVERLKALGNAVVPQQVYPILRGIAEIENERV